MEIMKIIRTILVPALSCFIGVGAFTSCKKDNGTTYTATFEMKKITE